jgi:hypothetical protein
MDQILNSYKLKTIDRTLLEGKFNVRWLRVFEPREVTELVMVQKAYMEQL